MMLLLLMGQEVFDYINSGVQEIKAICLNEQCDLDYQISYDKVKAAWQSLANGKARGHDGLGYEPLKCSVM